MKKIAKLLLFAICMTGAVEVSAQTNLPYIRLTYKPIAKGGLGKPHKTPTRDVCAICACFDAETQTLEFTLTDVQTPVQISYEVTDEYEAVLAADTALVDENGVAVPLTFTADGIYYLCVTIGDKEYIGEIVIGDDEGEE